jgi:DNA-binding NarL/FixJ family response regulator
MLSVSGDPGHSTKVIRLCHTLELAFELCCTSRSPGNRSFVAHEIPSTSDARYSTAIAIANDIVRVGLEAVLRKSGLFRISNSSATVDSVELANCRPRLMIVDPELPGISPARLMSELRNVAPQASIVALRHRPHADLDHLLRSRGITQISLWAPQASLITILSSAAASPTGVVGGGSTKLMMENLTSRETEVLSLIASAFPNKTIASMLGISEGTVKRHTNNLYRKLQVTSRVHALLEARRLGYVA